MLFVLRFSCNSFCGCMKRWNVSTYASILRVLNHFKSPFQPGLNSFSNLSSIGPHGATCLTLVATLHCSELVSPQMEDVLLCSMPLFMRQGPPWAHRGAGAPHQEPGKEIIRANSYCFMRFSIALWSTAFINIIPIFRHRSWDMERLSNFLRVIQILNDRVGI